MAPRARTTPPCGAVWARLKCHRRRLALAYLRWVRIPIFESGGAYSQLRANSSIVHAVLALKDLISVV